MTALSAARGTTASQSTWIARYFARSYLQVLSWALGIGVAISVTLYLVTGLFIFTIGDAEIVGNAGSMITPLAAVVIAAFSLAIAQGAYSRILIGQGATRLAIALGNVYAMGIGWVFIAIVVGLGTVVERVLPNATSLEAQFGLVLGWRHYLWFGGLIAAALISGGLIAAIFQRWHWLVGTTVIVAAVLVSSLAPMTGSESMTGSFWWIGLPWICAGILAGIFAWVLRGVEVN